jgi:predicted dienelactone hydrolase
MRRLRLAIAGLLFSAAPALAATPVGIADLHVADAARPLTGYVWYPAEPGGIPSKIGDTRLWVGVTAVWDTPVAPGRHPLVLLSHGLGGNALNLDWLAADLAARGMIVAAVNHPGTTRGDMDPRALLSVWNRPGDISHTISALLANPAYAGRIDPKQIAVVGHSLGGYTALALAGVRVAREGMGTYCDNHTDEGCSYPVVMQARKTRPEPRYEESNRDPRVAAVVAMAPGLTVTMTPESLAAVPVPVLLLAGAGDKLIEPAHVRAVAAKLPASATFVELPDVGHYDFMAACKQGGEALLSPDDEPVCETAIDRLALHAQVAERIEAFLAAQGFASMVQN